MNKQVKTVLEQIESIENTWSAKVGGSTVTLTSIPRESAQVIHFLVLASKAKTILELGCSAGYSAIWMASAAKEFGGTVHTTEILNEKADLAKRHFKESGLDNIILHEGDIIETLNKWKEPIDFAFIDSDKKPYLQYYEKVIEFLKPGGIIVADNAISHAEQMQDFLERIQNDPRVHSEISKVGKGLALIYKK